MGMLYHSDNLAGGDGDEYLHKPFFNNIFRSTEFVPVSLLLLLIVVSFISHFGGLSFCSESWRNY